MPRKASSSAQSGSRSSSGRSRASSSKSSSRATSSRASAGRTSGGRSVRSSGARSRGGAAQSTKDHEQIRRWVEERGGTPASVKGTERRGQDAGLLRIDFPGYSGAGKLEPISWEDFFQKFDEMNLTFLYQDATKGGKPSRFFKFVCEENIKRPRRNPRG